MLNIMLLYCQLISHIALLVWVKDLQKADFSILKLIKFDLNPLELASLTDSDTFLIHCFSFQLFAKVPLQAQFL